MANEELLLTPREIKHHLAELRARKPIGVGIGSEEKLEHLLKAQLAKADPLIRKDERERIIGIINDLNSIDYPYGGDYKAVILQALKEGK